MKWLITGFAPFGGAASNSSLIVLDHLRKQKLNGSLHFHFPVPVDFKQAWPNVREVLEQSGDFDGILALGEARSRVRLNCERVALNWIDAQMPDNDGQIVINKPIQSGPEILWSNIPWEDLEPSPHVVRSYSAGTYVCNALMYHLLDWALPQKKRAGFVHIPVLSSQQDVVFANCPRLEDRLAFQEMERITEFLVAL